MKKDKIRMFSLFCFLASASLIACMTATTAWFLGSSYLQISSFDMTIGAKQITVSTDNEEYKYELTKKDLKEVDFFAPCTSAFSDKWMEQKNQMPVFMPLYGDATSNIMDAFDYATPQETGYFSQELFFKADADCYMLIDPEESFVIANESHNESQAKSMEANNILPYEELVESLNSIKKSLRVSLLVLNNVDDPTDETYDYYIINPWKIDPDDNEIPEEHTVYGGLLDLNSDLYYDTVNDKEVVFGQMTNPDKIVYDDPTYEDIALSGHPTCFNAKHNGAARCFNYEASKENGFDFVEEPCYSLQEASTKAPIRLIKDQARRVIFSIYIEGWDRDNTNFTMYGGFKLNISFMMKLHL